MTSALKLIAEPRRQEILALIWDGERTAGAIAGAVDVSFSAVSQHLRVLLDGKLVRMRKSGRERLYRADREALGPLADYLEAQWRGRLAALKALAETVAARRVES